VEKVKADYNEDEQKDLNEATMLLRGWDG